MFLQHSIVFSSTLKKKAGRPASPRANPHAGRVIKTNPHFVCGAGQPGLHFAGLSGAGLCRTG